MFNPLRQHHQNQLVSGLGGLGSFLCKHHVSRPPPQSGAIQYSPKTLRIHFESRVRLPATVMRICNWLSDKLIMQPQDSASAIPDKRYARHRTSAHF